MSTPIGPRMAGMPSPLQSGDLDGPGPLVRSSGQENLLARMAPVTVAMPSPPSQRPQVDAEQGASRARGPLVTSAERESRHLNTCPSRSKPALDKLNQAAEKLKQADQVGVEVAKASWWKKALGVGIAVAAVVVAATLTAMSFGAAAPVLGIACAQLVVSTGNAVCAYRNYKNAEALASGQPQPYEKLPMGNDFIGNGTHYLLGKLGVEDPGAIAKGVSVALNLGLAVAGIACGTGLTGLPTAFEVVRHTINAANGAQMVLGAGVHFATGELDRDVVESETREIRQLALKAWDTLPMDHPDRLVAKQILDRLDGPNSPEAELARHQKAFRGVPEQILEEGPGALVSAVRAAPGALASGANALGGALSDGASAVADAVSSCVGELAQLMRDMPPMPLAMMPAPFGMHMA